MNLNKKKILASKTLGVGKGKIRFNSSRLDEIKEAITKQDFRDLFASGAIRIEENLGSRKREKRTTRRREGRVSRKVKDKKRNYITITRKLRGFLKQNKAKISREMYKKIRNEIKMRTIKNLAHLKEMIREEIKNV